MSLYMQLHVAFLPLGTGIFLTEFLKEKPTNFRIILGFKKMLQRY